MKNLPKSVFLGTFRYAPRVAIDLVIKDGNGVLLLRRSNPPRQGTWYVPGSFLRKNETIKRAIRRVALEDLNTSVTNPELLGIYENLRGDTRGHVVDLVYLCKISGAPRKTREQAKFFKGMPKNIFPGQGKIVSDALRR